MDKIILKSMTFKCCHGVLEIEKTNPQPFIVDISIIADLKAASKSDSVLDTINYAIVFEIVKNILEKNTFNLLEKIIYEIHKKLFDTFKIAKEISILIKKPNAPIDGDFEYMGVESVRKRNEI